MMKVTQMLDKIKLVARPAGVYKKPVASDLVCLTTPKATTGIRQSRAGLSNQIGPKRCANSVPALSTNAKDLRNAY